VQFPDAYVSLVHDAISGLKPSVQVNKLKVFARKYRHSLYGISERIRDFDSSFHLNVGGADTNLKKEFPTVGMILFKECSPHAYIEILKGLSPLFISLMWDQCENLSTRKIGELLGQESLLDAREVKASLMEAFLKKG